MISVRSTVRWQWREAPQAARERIVYRGRGVLAPAYDVDRPGVATRSIIVASSERTGSTMVVESLRRTGVAGVPYEYFNDDVIGEAIETLGVPRLTWSAKLRRQLRRALLRGDWAATWDVVPGSVEPYLDHLVRHRTTPNGVFATKLHWNHYVQMNAAGLSVDAFPQPVTWVHVTRRDRLAQAVSLARARQSGEWSATQVVRRRRPYAPFFDDAAISRALAEVHASNTGWERFFANSELAPIRVVYEDVAADYAGEMRRLFETLRLDAVADRTPPTLRQADETTAGWIEQYRRLHPGVRHPDVADEPPAACR